MLDMGFVIVFLLLLANKLNNYNKWAKQSASRVGFLEMATST
jgi:hypothetical protein